MNLFESNIFLKTTAAKGTCILSVGGPNGRKAVSFLRELLMFIGEPTKRKTQQVQQMLISQRLFDVKEAMPWALGELPSVNIGIQLTTKWGSVGGICSMGGFQLASLELTIPKETFVSW